MALGRKTGGRAKGTPNRRTVEIQSRLNSMGCDPLAGMAQLAMDMSNSAELRGRMYAELAQYIYPKRRACEVKGESGPKIVFHLDTVGASGGGPRSTEVDPDAS